MTVARDTYLSRTLALAGWDTLPANATARTTRVKLDQALLQHAQLVLLSSEPYRFRDRDLAELRALPVMRGKTVTLIDGEAASWYGSRAIAGLDYLRGIRQKLSGRDAQANRFGKLR